MPAWVNGTKETGSGGLVHGGGNGVDRVNDIYLFM